VLRETKRVAGIDATVVHDRVSKRGAIVEDTYDWYAQDTAGTVWYLGEDTKEYRGGKIVSTAGSWQAARSLGAWSLVGCIVAPAFDFTGFELAPTGWEPPVSPPPVSLGG